MGWAVCPPCFHSERGQTWTTGGAREVVGTLSRSSEQREVWEGAHRLSLRDGSCADEMRGRD